MSYHEYIESGQIAASGVSFGAALMAAMRLADTENAAKLCEAFPAVADEVIARNDAPGGLIAKEYAR